MRLVVVTLRWPHRTETETGKKTIAYQEAIIFNKLYVVISRLDYHF